MVKKKCAFCGKEFEGRNNYAKYCQDCKHIHKICAYCGKEFELSISQLNKLYNYCGNKDKLKFYCSRKCAANSNEVQDKIKQTNLDKYGTEYSLMNEEVKKRGKETLKKKYGVDNASKSKIIKKKKKETCLKHYGVDNPGKSPEVRNEMRKTCKKKYGYEFPLQSEECKNKFAETCSKRYGVEHPSKLNSVKEKKKKTCLKHYGVENPSKSELIKYQKEQTMLQNIGVAYPMQDKQLADIIMQKSSATRCNNGGRSSDEILFEEFLIECGYEKDKDYKIEYKSEPYPFYCDFYIVERNLFIELNCFPTHGKHWFNKNSKEDLTLIEIYKSKVGEHKLYKNFIDTWTKRDVKKRAVAKRNRLNYVVLWSKKDIYDWFINGMPNGFDWKNEYSWRTS